MIDPVKDKAHAAHLGVVVRDAIKIAIELPGDQVFRRLEIKGLIGHQWQDRARRHRIYDLVDGHFLRLSCIEDNGIDHLSFSVEQSMAAKGGIADAHDKFSVGGLVFELPFHTKVF